MIPAGCCADLSLADFSTLGSFSLVPLESEEDEFEIGPEGDVRGTMVCFSVFLVFPEGVAATAASAACCCLRI